MKLSQIAVAIAGTWMLTGCSELVSLQPFVTEQEAVQDSRLPGVWMDNDDFYIVKQNSNGYTISHSEKGTGPVYRLNAMMLKVGDARILDLTPADDDAFQVPAHTPMRVWVTGATLRIAYLDSNWLREHASGQLAVQQVNGRMVITSPAEEVTRFLLAYGADDRAYSKPNVLTRQQ